MRSFFDELVIPILAMLIMLTALIGSIVCGINRLTFPGSVAEIETLRESLKNTNIAEAEDVVGQVVAANIKISIMQTYNNKAWADLFIPDGWDSIEPINIKRSQK